LTRTIRTVKREIRVLGLDTCRKGLVYGAVVRGGLYLDGVISHKMESSVEQGLAKAILASKYYPELRVLMTHDPRHQIGCALLEQLVRLPVMEVSLSKRPRKGFSLFGSERGRVLYQSRLAQSIAERIMSLTWLYGELPEPVRIAHLLSRAGSSS
jgi:endonuclease V-like protein UPF0215 family